LPNSFFPKEITYGFYEAHTHLEGGVSRCTTCVDVRHLYDTRTTPIGIVKQNLPKMFFFFFLHSKRVKHVLKQCFIHY
jgi:hypothetical protein